MKSFVNIEMIKEIGEEQKELMQELINSPKLMETTKEIYHVAIRNVFGEELDDCEVNIDIGIRE